MTYFAITIVVIIAAPVFLGWWSLLVIPVFTGLGGWYLWLSAERINQDVLAGRLSLGKFTEELNPGLNLIWAGFDEIVEVSTNTHEQDVPASPEFIDHVDRSKPKADGSPGDGVPPPGMVPALRVTFLEKVPEEKDGVKQPIEVKSTTNSDGTPRPPVVIGVVPPDDSFLKRQTAEYEASFGFIVKRRHLQTFYTTIGDVEKAKRNMMDFVISVLSGELQRHCLAEAMLLKDEIEAKVRVQLKSFCEEAWGIEVTFFRMKPFTFSHDFNKELSNAAAANETAKAMIRISEGEMQKRIKEGTGSAKAEQMMLDARTESFRKMAEIAKTPEGQFVMANDAARAIAKASTVIVPSGDVFGSVLGVANVMQRNFQQNASSASVSVPVAPTIPSPTTKESGGEKKGPKPSAEPTARSTDSRPRGRKRTWEDRKR